MGKLTFKGEAPKKKKKKVKAIPTQQEEDEEISGWLPIPSASLALGPTYLTLPSTALTPTPICLALQPTTGKIYPHPIPPAEALPPPTAPGLEDEDEQALVVESEAGSQGPTDVNHVWVCTRIPDTMNRVTFRSGAGKFLAVDELGIVSAEREARGVQEEFTLEEAEGGAGGLTVVKSSYGKYLSVDVLAGGKMELRADEETEGETERWRLWMQGEFLPKARKSLMERSGVKAAVANDGLTVVGDVGAAEKDLIQKYQARGQGRYVGSAEDKKELKRARQDGKLGEAMLERRVKLKSDRYC